MWCYLFNEIAGKNGPIVRYCGNSGKVNFVRFYIYLVRAFLPAEQFRVVERSPAWNVEPAVEKKAFKMKKAIIITSSSGNVRQAAIKKAVKGKSRPLRKNQSLPLMEQLRPQCNLIAMICDLFTENYSTVDIAVKRWLITWLKSKMAYSCPSDVVVVVPLLLHCSLVHWSNQANETMIRCCWESQVISLSIPLAMLHFSAVTAQLVQNKCTTRLVGYKRKVIFGKMSSLWTCCSRSKIAVL